MCKVEKKMQQKTMLESGCQRKVRRTHVVFVKRLVITKLHVRMLREFWTRGKGEGQKQEYQEANAQGGEQRSKMSDDVQHNQAAYG